MYRLISKNSFEFFVIDRIARTGRTIPIEVHACLRQECLT